MRNVYSGKQQGQGSGDRAGTECYAALTALIAVLDRRLGMPNAARDVVSASSVGAVEAAQPSVNGDNSVREVSRVCRLQRFSWARVRG